MKLKFIKRYSIIAFGLLIHAVGWRYFLEPNNVIIGGLYSVAIIIANFIGISAAEHASHIYAVLNLVLVAVAFKYLTKREILDIIVVGTIIFELWFTLLGMFPLIPLPDDTFFAVFVGASLTAIGLAVALLQGASSGGTDIIGVMFVKNTPITYGTFYFVSDVLILLLYVLSFPYDVEIAIYSIFSIIIFSIVMDIAIAGLNRSVQFFIISDKYEEIADFIVNDMDRGTTLIEAKGWYTKEDRKVLITVTRQQDTGTLMRKVKSIDPDAFVTISKVSSAIGEGFEKNKY